MRRKNKLIFSYVLIFSLVLTLFNINIKADEIYINARTAVAIDSKSKVTLFDKDAHMLIPMASTTKIMTALVAINYGDLDRKVEISSKSAGIRGSTVGYKKGEMITLRELLYGLMLRSGNDAAIAISEGIAGSVEEFVKLMNEYASQIGLVSTHFESPHGLDSDYHYTTAYDLAVITSKARESRIFSDIVQTKDIDKEQYNFSRSFHNINKILWQLPNATGVKTGFTGKAGKCLVTSVNIDNNDVIIVVLNSNTRWKETEKISNFVAKHYKYKKFFSKGEIVGEANVANKSRSLKLVTSEDVVIPVKDDIHYEVKIVKPNYKLEGPISKGSKVGSLEIYAEGKKIYTKALESDTEFKEKGKLRRWFHK